VLKKSVFSGCNVLIASRNIDRLHGAAKELRSVVPEGSEAQLEVMECNIRKEEQVRPKFSLAL